MFRAVCLIGTLLLATTACKKSGPAVSGVAGDLSSPASSQESGPMAAFLAETEVIIGELGQGNVEVAAVNREAGLGGSAYGLTDAAAPAEPKTIEDVCGKVPLEDCLLKKVDSIKAAVKLIKRELGNDDSLYHVQLNKKFNEQGYDISQPEYQMARKAMLQLADMISEFLDTRTTRSVVRLATAAQLYRRMNNGKGLEDQIKGTKLEGTVVDALVELNRMEGQLNLAVGAINKAEDIRDLKKNASSKLDSLYGSLKTKLGSEPKQ